MNGDRIEFAGENWVQEYFSLLDCISAFRNDLSNSYIEGRLSDFLTRIIQEHGFDRVRQIVAMTINSVPSESRYIRQVKLWASRFPSFRQNPLRDENTEKSDFRELCIKEHPAITNEVARILMRFERTKAKGIEKAECDR